MSKEKDWHWEDAGEGWIKRVSKTDDKGPEPVVKEEAMPYEKQANSLMTQIGAQISRSHLGIVHFYFRAMVSIGRKEVEHEWYGDALRYGYLLECAEKLIKCKGDLHSNMPEAFRNIEEAIKLIHENIKEPAVVANLEEVGSAERVGDHLDVQINGDLTWKENEKIYRIR